MDMWTEESWAKDKQNLIPYDVKLGDELTIEITDCLPNGKFQFCLIDENDKKMEVIEGPDGQLYLRYL